MEIVIIDDEPVSLTVMKQLVAKLPNCEVHAFTNPSAALIWCTNNTPNLVLVDYMMPTMDGIEFSRRVRALPTGRRTPIVMVSAVVDQQVIKRALQNGIDDFLNKPFDFMQLQTCVSEMLGLRAMQGQLANKSLLLAARALTADKKAESVPNLLDWDLSRARLGGDEKLLGEIAGMLVSTVPGLLSLIKSAIVDADFDGVLLHVIALKGAVAAVEAQNVSSALSRLEVQARSRAPLASITAFKQVQALAERLVAELAPVVPTVDERHGDEWALSYQSAAFCQD